MTLWGGQEHCVFHHCQVSERVPILAHCKALYISQNVPAFSKFLHRNGWNVLDHMITKNFCTNVQFCASFQSTLRPVPTKKTEGTNLCFRWKNMRFTKWVEIQFLSLCEIHCILAIFKLLAPIYNNIPSYYSVRNISNFFVPIHVDPAWSACVRWQGNSLHPALWRTSPTWLQRSMKHMNAGTTRPARSTKHLSVKEYHIWDRCLTKTMKCIVF